MIPKKPTYIANVACRGYRLVAPVSSWVEPSTNAISDAISAPAPSDKPSIAVIPFLNLSGDLGHEYFSDGVTEDIITELSRWRRISVRSRSASFRYRGAAVDIKQIAREVDVRFVVEGSVRRLGERILATFSRVRTRTYFYAALMAGCHAKLGDMHRGKASAIDRLSMKPEFSTKQLMGKLPFKIPADAEQIASSLRLAGLPE